MKSVLLLLAAVLLLQGCASRRTKPSDTAFHGKPMILWLDDATYRTKVSGAGIEKFCTRAHEAGFTHLAIEARDAEGAWVDPSRYRALRDAAKPAGIRLATVLPMFIATANDVRSQHAVWNGNAYEIQTPGDVPLRSSPAVPQTRQRELDAVRQLAADSKNDYIILSGCGFEDELSDLSPAGRHAYESWSGLTILRWPEDVIGMAPGAVPLGPAGRGPYWENWVLWRATVLRDMMISLRDAAHQPEGVKQPLVVALVDAPYAVHQREGLNWASAQSSVSSDFPWMGSVYTTSAAAHLLDAVCLGFWENGLLTAEDAQARGFAWWASVEGASAGARRYLPKETQRWAAVRIAPGENWKATAFRARQLNDGLLIIGASHLIDDAGCWEQVTDVLKSQEPATTN